MSRRKKYINEYCIGFVFDIMMSSVVLIQKKKPEHLAGFWNGVGGKIEDGELPLKAMVRECKEETGLDVRPEYWTPVIDYDHALKRSEWSKLPIFYARMPYDMLIQAKTMETESVKVFYVDNYGNINNTTNVVPNIKWILPYIHWSSKRKVSILSLSELEERQHVLL